MKTDASGIKWAVIALVLAVGLKIWLTAGNWAPFNSDEAVVALMARHILAGDRPIFFYGQAYMGSLDAFLVAAGFWIFGQQVWVIRLVQGLLFIGVMLTSAWLGKLSFGSWKVGSLAMLILAIPTVNVSLYTTASLGGYGEALLLGNGILICGLTIGNCLKKDHQPGPIWPWMLLGFLSGIGLWAFGITLIYSLPIVVYLLILSIENLRRESHSENSVNKRVERENSGRSTQKSYMQRSIVNWMGAFAGILLGSIPWWGSALAHGFASLVSELGGSAIAGVEQLPYLLQVWRHIVNFALLGSTVILGLRPPWDMIWLAWPLLPFVLIFWMAVIGYMIRCLRTPNNQRDAQGVLVGVMLTLLLGFIFTPFGADPSGRYFVPLAAPMALFAAAMIQDLASRPRIGNWAYLLLALLLVYNLWGTVQSALRYPPGITTQFYYPTQIDHRYDQELITFLRDKGETRGYGNYWVAYPLAFLSEEDLIFVPRLPYHLDFRYSERDDRYQPYQDVVSRSQKVAYITTNHPDLDDRLRTSFGEMGVTWRETRIGDYLVFYGLSRVVRPEEIGLGATTTP